MRFQIFRIKWKKANLNRSRFDAQSEVFDTVDKIANKTLYGEWHRIGIFNYLEEVIAILAHNTPSNCDLSIGDEIGFLIKITSYDKMIVYEGPQEKFKSWFCLLYPEKTSLTVNVKDLLQSKVIQWHAVARTHGWLGTWFRYDIQTVIDLLGVDVTSLIRYDIEDLGSYTVVWWVPLLGFDGAYELKRLFMTKTNEIPANMSVEKHIMSATIQIKYDADLYCPTISSVCER